MDQATVISITENLYLATLVVSALNGLWIYDWFLTLGNEINYAWSGRKSWTFLLFLANRYIPCLEVVWVNVVMFGNIKNICLHSGWLLGTCQGLVTVTTQMAIAMRVYVVTGKNKLLCSLLFLLIAMQILGAMIMAIIFLRLPDQPLPEEILNLFRFCTLKLWKPGVLAYATLVLAFDILAFSIIAFKARKELPPTSWGIRSLWTVILRDATLYFVIISFIQFCALLLPFVTTQSIQIMPAAVNAIVVPILASRLMLSLKMAAAKPAQVSSFRLTTTVLRTGNNIEFAPVL